MLSRRIIISLTIFLLITPLLCLSMQSEPQPLQRVDPQIAKIVSEISVERLASTKTSSLETS
jgi:hypothetical protein